MGREPSRGERGAIGDQKRGSDRAGELDVLTGLRDYRRSVKTSLTDRCQRGEMFRVYNRRGLQVGWFVGIECSL